MNTIEELESLHACTHESNQFSKSKKNYNSLSKLLSAIFFNIADNKNVWTKGEKKNKKL